MVVGVRQSFQFFRQKTWFLENSRALSKILYRILQNSFILTTRATLKHSSSRHMLQNIMYTKIVGHLWRVKCQKWLSNQKIKRINLLLRSWRIIIWLEIYQKKNLEDFVKIIFYFLRACDTNTCSVEITGKFINQEDGKGMKGCCNYIFQLRIVL